MITLFGYIHPIKLLYLLELFITDPDAHGDLLVNSI